MIVQANLEKFIHHENFNIYEEQYTIYIAIDPLVYITMCSGCMRKSRGGSM